ncbi:MAG: YidB family protein, partial [bacterium]
EVGGLEGLVQKFSGKGMGDIVNSWVGLGQNQSITPQQITHGLGTDTINLLASKAGLSTDQVTSQLSELLPKVVDKLTPNGKIPQGDMLAKGVDLLKGFLN